MDGTELEALLGCPVAAVEPASWGFTNRTAIVTLTDGRRVVVQLYADRRAAAHRLEATRQLAPVLRTEGIPTPVLLDADLAAEPPYGVFEALPGEPGYVVAEHDLSAPIFPALAEAMGRLVARLQTVPVDSVTLPATWAEPHRLATAATGWLEQIATVITPAEAKQVEQLISTLPALFADRPVVVAHGDLTPSNVLFTGSVITGLLDLESARLADSLLDVAWWKWLLHAHTPRAFAASWPGFLAAAGVDAEQDRFEERVYTLLIVRLLETASGYANPAWGERLSRALVEYVP